MKLLAIDDDNCDNLAVLSGTFPEAVLLSAADGPSGIALAAAEDPDVILLASSEICRQLKQDERLRSIPVVFLTAFRTDRESRREALEAGAEGFLSKPLDDLDLGAMVRAMVKVKASRELRGREQRWQAILGTAMDGFWLMDRHARILEVNDAALRLSGFSREEMLRMSISDLEAAENPGEVEAHVARIIASGSDSFESRHRCKDGSVIDVQISTSYLPEYGIFFAFTRDVTARRRADEALRASEELYRRTVETAEEGIWMLDPRGVVVFANKRMAAMLGYSVEELVGRPASAFVAEEQRDLARSAADRYEIAFRRRSGEPLHALVAACPMLDREGRNTGVLGMVTDITGRKAQEEERQATIDLLRLLNSSRDLHEVIRDVTALLQQFSGCEAVGIRLRDGADFPYFETRGFPPEFVKLENSLCARGLDGKSVWDSQGNPVLECMCGNVVCGRFDPAKDFFTAQGSFWTNCSTRLLASTAVEDRQSRTRNRCNGEGYESVALIPLRSGDRIIGLLQFNDRREGRFSAGKMQLLERVAANVALALEQRLTHRSLEESEGHFRLLFNGMAEGVAMCRMIFEEGLPTDFIYLEVNEAFEKLTGLRNVIGRRVSEIIPGLRESDPGLFETYGRVALSGRAERFETFVQAMQMWFSISVYCPAPEHFVAVFDVITERKRAEEELRRNRDLLKAVVEGTSDAVYAKDTRGRYLLLNSAAEGFIGKPAEEVLGKDDTFLFPPEEARAVMEGDRSVMEAGEACTYEEFITGASGRLTTFLSTKGPLMNAAGEVTGLFGIARDITDRRRAEEELRLSRQRLSLHVEQTPLAVVEFDLNGRISAWNPAAVQVFGYSREEALGRYWHFIVPEPVWASVDRVWEGLVTQVGGSRSTNENVTKDGRRIWCEWFNTPLVDAAGRTVAVASLVMDVTERLRTEEALRQSESKYRIVAENTYDWEFWVGADGRFLYCSPSCERITGHRATEFLEDISLLKQVIHVNDRRAFARHQREALSRKEAGEIEFRIVRPDGVVRWIGHSCQPVFGADGAYLGARGSHRDITVRRSAEEERESLHAQLTQAQKMESIGRLAGGVAHDFNNLLTVINGYSKLLLDGLPETEPAHEMMSEVLRAGERAADLTQQLLAFSRRQPAQPQSVDLNRTIVQSKNMLERLLGEDIRLSTRLDSGLGHVMIDPGQAHQILMNLAVNARDAMPGGGVLSIETANAELDGRQTPDESAVPGSYIRLSVIDTGTGMDAETQRRLFEPFFTTKELGKGTGLGLAMVYGIVKQYGGWIRVDSRLGEGSAFHVYLPQTGADARESGAAPNPCPGSGSETVLVVEDRSDVRRFAVSVLSKCGYHVLEAAGANDALRLAEERHDSISLMITDVVMPDMSGVELAARLKAVQPDMGVVYMSGHSEAVLARGGIIGSEYDYLAKPFGPNELIRKVRGALDSRRP